VKKEKKKREVKQTTITKGGKKERRLWVESRHVIRHQKRK
jgi:hypothetical protein